MKLSLAGRQYEGVPKSTADGAELQLLPGERAIIPLGFRATLPPGYEAQIRPRSGTSFKTSLAIANSPGTIDPDYNATVDARDLDALLRALDLVDTPVHLVGASIGGVA